MKLEILYKRSGDGCPTIYIAEDDSIVIQGDLVSEDVTTSLEELLPGEAAVSISPELLLGAALQYTTRHKI